MITAQAQRTLVKSPPELWTELSDPVALARHLGEFGEITITRIEPECKVEWETDGASGVVELKPSGWGTKVTLSLTHERSEPQPTASPSVHPRSAPQGPTRPAPQGPPRPRADSPPQPAQAPARPDPQPLPSSPTGDDAIAPATSTPSLVTPPAALASASDSAPAVRPPGEDRRRADQAQPSSAEPPVVEPAAEPGPRASETSQAPPRSEDNAVPGSAEQPAGFLRRILQRLRTRSRAVGPAVVAASTDPRPPLPEDSSAQAASPDPAEDGGSPKAGRTAAPVTPDATTAGSADAPPTSPPGESSPPGDILVSRAGADDNPTAATPAGQGPSSAEDASQLGRDLLESLVIQPASAVPAEEISPKPVTSSDESSTSPAAEEATTAAPVKSVAGPLNEERTTELLKAVLDRLGEAHHRPFSRA